eukprot:GHRQ01012484.1.p3 GENE.GHRQ01012484.1~~GHRQ01012484.1.p3  ORF type:complete len:128 (+),score=30.22 GHRQ01012484.1:1815-2198(+)
MLQQSVHRCVIAAAQLLQMLQLVTVERCSPSQHSSSHVREVGQVLHHVAVRQLACQAKVHHVEPAPAHSRTPVHLLCHAMQLISMQPAAEGQLVMSTAAHWLQQPTADSIQPAACSEPTALSEPAVK